jgi:ankyrin repeat protein
MDLNGSTPLHIASSLRNSNGFTQLLKANPTAVYKADNNGLFPIHVAASVGAEDTVKKIVKMFPSCAGLRTAHGRTFLHVSIENTRMPIVFYVCKTPHLAWILNMQDNDGNTALHLAVQAKSLRMFGCLYGSKEVHLSLANSKQQTPVDISRALLPRGLYFDWVMYSHLY